jgi:hypothetical protein
VENLLFSLEPTKFKSGQFLKEPVFLELDETVQMVLSFCSTPTTS